MFKVTKRKIVAGVVAAGVVAMTGVAYGYWTSTGSGSGSASTGSATAWEVTTDAATGGDLTPGGATDTVGYHVKNNNAGQQSVAQVAIKVANADGSAWNDGACTKDDFSVGGEAAGVTHIDTTGYPDNLAAGATHDDSVTL